MRMLALYPWGIPRSEPPSCEAPRQPTIHGPIHGRLCDPPCFMFMGVNRVIHFPRCEVKTIHVGRCKVSVTETEV